MQTSFANLMASIAEPQMRLRRMAEFLSTGSPAVVVITLEKAALSTHVPAQRVLYTSLVHLLLTIRPRPALPAGPLPLEERALLPTEGHMDELVKVADQLRARFTHALLRQMWSPPDRYDHHLLPLHVTIDHISLGHRRQRARLADRERWKPLLVDTTPSVVQLLAANPRLREEEMVQMAAMRPNHPWALWAILLTFRWLANDRVREAVALNPSSRSWMVLALAPLLGPRKVEEAVRKIRLPVEVLQALLPLFDGACAELVREAIAKGPPHLGPLIIHVEETVDEAAAFFAEEQASVESEVD